MLRYRKRVVETVEAEQEPGEVDAHGDGHGDWIVRYPDGHETRMSDADFRSTWEVDWARGSMNDVQGVNRS